MPRPSSAGPLRCGRVPPLWEIRTICGIDARLTLLRRVVHVGPVPRRQAAAELPSHRIRRIAAGVFLFREGILDPAGIGLTRLACALTHTPPGKLGRDWKLGNPTNSNRHFSSFFFAASPPVARI